MKRTHVAVTALVLIAFGIQSGAAQLAPYMMGHCNLGMVVAIVLSAYLPATTLTAYVTYTLVRFSIGNENVLILLAKSTVSFLMVSRICYSFFDRGILRAVVFAFMGSLFELVISVVVAPRTVKLYTVTDFLLPIVFNVVGTTILAFVVGLSVRNEL